jgi:hypothetical protein
MDEKLIDLDKDRCKKSKVNWNSGSAENPLKIKSKVEIAREAYYTKCKEDKC